MLLRDLTIVNFKNIRDAGLEFSPSVNGFLGHNGMGKSNLLDAIHYLSFCKSFSGLNDPQLITRGENFAMVKGNYLRRGVDEEISAGLMQGRRKSFKRKNKEYARLSEHIGLFPLVLVSPSDSVLITGTAEERRRLMDMVISQSDPVYLNSLIRYNRLLEQRNKLLREHVVDHTLYQAVELPLEAAASVITRCRREWVDSLEQVFTGYYQAIAGEQQQVKLGYQSPQEPLTQQLDSARRRDEALGYTTVGPHREDLEMEINNMPARRIASQGECKTYTIALRLAQYEYLRATTGMKPLLLLDDIFDKLDTNRVERIIELTRRAEIGQIFVTDTNRDHLNEVMERIGGDYRLWEVTDGSFHLLTTTPL